MENFDYIDRFRNGLARVRKGNKWGIVNEDFEIVVPIEYDSVWKFWDKTFNNIVLEKDGEKFKVSFDNPTVVKPYDSPSYHRRSRNYDEDYYEDSYGRHYGEFAGSYAQDVMGYSDDVINDAFEGDPDAYWNID